MRLHFIRVIGFFLSGILLILSPGVQAEIFSGKLNGYDCARAGITCPLDRNDPHVALERDFVLQLQSGDYLFLTNLPRDIKLKHVLKDVQIYGKRHAKFESVDVDELRIKKGDKWQPVWFKRIKEEQELETVTGKLNGHDCVHAGISCPADPQDPHLLLERDYVLQQENGDYFFLMNIPRSTKLQYVLKDIQITGRINKKYNSVEVYELKIIQDDEWKSVWIRRE
jgi:hypothetical protein